MFKRQRMTVLEAPMPAHNPIELPLRIQDHHQIFMIDSNSPLDMTCP